MLKFPNRIVSRNNSLLILFAIFLGSNNSLLLGQQNEHKTVRVFILAGQSNMVGHGVVDLDDEKDYNGGKGTLVQVMESARDKAPFKHVRSADGSWSVRDDVFVRYISPRGELKKGGLTIGFTGRSGDPHHIGPEYQFGHVVGNAFDEPVLLIKTAWGGKSLFKDFRPPSSGGEVGPYYIKMLEQVGEAIEKAPTEFPELADSKLVISGFVWQQGWNDMIDDAATAEYEQNLLNLVKDVRKQFGISDLPVVVGELGNGGARNVNPKMKAFRQAQGKVDDYGDLNVAFVSTTRFARPAEQSPNVTHAHHWFGNAESYFLVGESLGHRMVRLISDKDKPRVLILGDSISIGYTPFVREMMKDEAAVFRPMRTHQAPENCAGTDYGIANIDRWLKMEGGTWDVIHFNFGLHDLKHVNGETGKNSNSPDDPLQSSPEEYRTQLREIAGKLKATGAKLIFCTTTPVPEGCKPLREVDSPQIYNAIGKEIAAEIGAEVNDLFAFADPQLEKIQRPANVHFSPAGSKQLATKVAESLHKALSEIK